MESSAINSGRSRTEVVLGQQFGCTPLRMRSDYPRYLRMHLSASLLAVRPPRLPTLPGWLVRHNIVLKRTETRGMRVSLTCSALLSATSVLNHGHGRICVGDTVNLAAAWPCVGHTVSQSTRSH